LISVLVASSSLVARAGLKYLVEQIPDCALAASVHSSDLVDRATELRPDVVLWQTAPDDEPGTVLHALRQPLVLLTGSPVSELIRVGARGVLRPDASEEQIAAAIQAAAANLVVYSSEEPAAVASTALTPRETEVLRMIADGLANKEIAYRMGISEHTVKFHVSALLGKLGVVSRAEAVGAGIRQGLIMV
jgi:DNA-binding NarL/FixJ family response regulator